METAVSKIHFQDSFDYFLPIEMKKAETTEHVLNVEEYTDYKSKKQIDNAKKKIRKQEFKTAWKMVYKRTAPITSNSETHQIRVK